MINKWAVAINSLKIPKIKKILLYEMKFLVPNYSWLQNLWLGGYCPQIPQAEACNTDTTPTQPHRNSNTPRTKNNTTNVVTQQNSSKLLMMDILMSETCWAHKKWNKIASDSKSVFYSSVFIVMYRAERLLYCILLYCITLYYEWHSNNVLQRKMPYKYFTRL